MIVLPYVLRLVVAAATGFDRSVAQAAQSLGASALDGVPPHRAAADRAGRGWRLADRLHQQLRRADHVDLRGQRGHADAAGEDVQPIARTIDPLLASVSTVLIVLTLALMLVLDRFYAWTACSRSEARPTMTTRRDLDTLVIGGGVVGLSLVTAWRVPASACCCSTRVTMPTAPRGNFGLVGAGQGAGLPAHARWTMKSAAAWPTFASSRIAERTGVDVELSQPGGMTMPGRGRDGRSRCPAHAPARQPQQAYPFEMLDAAAVRRLIPQTGPDVVGAVWACWTATPARCGCCVRRCRPQREAASWRPVRASRPSRRARAASVHAAAGTLSAPRLVLAVRLGNNTRAGSGRPVRAGFQLRVVILVTERLQPFLRHPHAVYCARRARALRSASRRKTSVTTTVTTLA